MTHPLSFLPQQSRKPLFYGFLALTIAIFGIFNVLDAPLRTTPAPNGIVSYELAGSVDSAQAMIASWDESARQYAAFGLGFDYLFMPVYALALCLGILLANDDRNGRIAALAGWAVLAAPLFDAVENFALWRQLINGAVSPLPQFAAACASVKFFLLIGGVLSALFLRFYRR